MKTNIELEILSSLDMSDPRLTKESVICADVRRATGERMTDAEILRAVRRLEKKGQIIGTPHEDLGNRWRMTDEGRLRYLESNH